MLLELIDTKFGFLLWATSPHPQVSPSVHLMVLMSLHVAQSLSTSPSVFDTGHGQVLAGGELTLHAPMHKRSNFGACQRMYVLTYRI